MSAASARTSWRTKSRSRSTRIQPSICRRPSGLPPCRIGVLVNSGYPVHPLADLGETASSSPISWPHPISENLLTLMARGGFDGYPSWARRRRCCRRDRSVADKDLIVIGAIRPALIARWRRTATRGRWRAACGSGRHRRSIASTRCSTQTRTRTRADRPVAGVAGRQSRGIDRHAVAVNSRRSVIVLTGSSPDKLLTVIATFRNRELNPSSRAI